MIKSPKVSIIILNWNGLDDTIECLESLKKITYPSYKVILVDNASERNDVEVLRDKFGDYIQIIENDRNYGFAEGNDIGMRYALKEGTDYILLLNNDTVVDPEFLTELVNVAESHERAGIVGPKFYDYDKPDAIQSCGGKLNLWTGGFHWIGMHEKDSGQYEKVFEVDNILGAALLAKASMIIEVGMLDPIFFANWEETDWCMRARKRGYKIICNPKAKVWHKISRSLPLYDSKRIYLILRNNIIFMRKNSRITHFPSFLAFYFLLRVPAFSLGLFRYSSIKNPFSIASLVIEAVWDGITVDISKTGY